MKLLCYVIAATLAGLLPGKAAEVRAPVVGLLKIDCPSGSDTRTSAPFHRSPRWTGRLAADPSDAGGGVARLSLAGSPGFATGELTGSPHYLLCRDSAAGPEGRHFPIVAHGDSTVDVEATPGDLAGLEPESLVSVIPAWTLDSLFPPGVQTTFHPSTGRLASGRGSELLFFDDDTSGSGLAPSRSFFVTGSAWLETGSFAEAGNETIAPGKPFLIRHPDNLPATEFVAVEQVYGGVVAMPVRVSRGRPQDTVLAPPRPVPVTLAELDLGPVFEDSASTDPADRADELLVFDNAAAGLNKAPSATYFRSGGQWIEDADGFPSAEAVEIEPSAGLLLRKAPGTENLTLFWSNSALYDVTAP